MRRDYCTYFDHRYLARGLALFRSLERHAGDFRLFVQKLGYQALIALGVLENPLTRTRAAHLGQARGLIDDLRMLREKTRTNLDAAEEEHLERVIDELERHLGQLARRGEG